MGTQYHKFHNGEFVLHKVTVNNQTYSAWYNKDGMLKDAERITNHKVCSLPLRAKNIRAKLEEIGKRYVV